MIDYEPRGPVTEADVERLEERLQLRLPGDYRTWLRDNDGAELGTLRVRGGLVHSLLGVLDTGDGDGLGQSEAGRAGSFSSWVPVDWLPVSGGSGGAVCVKVAGDDVGSVWWADYDLAEEIEPRDADQPEGLPMPQIMERLADSWAGFLSQYEEPALSPELLAYIDSVSPQQP
jgi:SMI1 / KNR4 family (SUKH-1)